MAVLSSALILFAAAQAFATPAMTSTLSVSTVATGSKVDLTTQIPAVSDVGSATQEIIQSIDSTKVKLTSASDVIAPEGWTVTYSTDGTNFSATPSSWAAVVKVKATGTVNSGGVSGDKQLYQTSANAPGTITTPNGVSRSGGDGWDVEFDSRGYIYNWYHHGALSSGLDCRDRLTGALCAGSWPMSLSTNGFYSPFQSTLFFDEVNKHIWLPAADRSTGTGFLCVDVTTVTTPALCGGSKATAWTMLNARANAQETGIEQIIASEGKIYSWDLLSGKILCYDYLSNNGLGAACSNMPTITVTAGSANALNQNPTSTMTYFREAFGNIYGELNSSVTCFNAKTMAKCTGWANYSQSLTGGNGHALYLQPNASGQIVGVCTATNAKCFAADGTTFNTTTVVQNALNGGNMGRWNGSMLTVGSKFLFNNIWTSSNIYCYDFATSAACSGWSASNGVGQISTSRVYTMDLDPLSNDCVWTNSDNGTPMIGQVTISTGQGGCSIKLASSTYKQADINPRLTCDGTSGAGYSRFTLSGLTKGADYTSASLSIFKANGDVLVSGGTTWDNVALNSDNYVDLTGIIATDLGKNGVFKINYVGKTSTTTATGTLLMQSNSAQLCLSLTAKMVCPSTVLVGTPTDSTTNFSATGATINAASVRTDYSITSGNLTIGAPLASDCGFVLNAVIGRGQASQAFPGSPVSVEGAVAYLTDTSGTVLNDANGSPIKATSDANGNLSFGAIKAGSYKVAFADFPLVNGVGAGDIASTYISPYGFVTGQINRTSQNPDANFTTIQTPLTTPTFTGVAGTPLVVKALYVMRAVAGNDTVGIKGGATSSIDVLANDKPTTTASFTTSSLKICALGTSTGCTLTSLVIPNQGTYAVLSGKITFTPVSNYIGPVTTVTYQVADGYSNTPQTVYATLASTVVGAPTVAADTLSGNTLAAITVDVTANDTAAQGTTLDKSSVKLCAVSTTTNCALTSVAITGKGTYSVSNLGVVTFTPESGYVGAVPAITYSINDAAGNTGISTVTATVTSTPPVITTGTLANVAQGIVMTPATQSVTVGSGSIPATGAWLLESGSLPAGVSLNANTGAISGTPTGTGSFTFTVKVTDSNGLVATKTETLNVYVAPEVTTTPLTVRAYSSAAISIANTVTLGSASLQSSTGWSATGLPSGLSINGSTGVISGSVTADGTYNIVVRALDQNGLSDDATITLTITSKPTITTNATLASAVIGVQVSPISQTKTQGTATIPTTGAWSISAGALPAGMSLNPDTGEITGTPTQSGVFSFTVQLVDSAGEIATKAESLTVNSGPTITTDPLSYKLYKDVSTSITNNVTIGTGSIRSGTGWTATGLPAGVSINGSTGEITGTPTVTGTFQVTIRATDVNGLYDEETLAFSVVTRPLITTTTPLTNAVIGSAITAIPQTVTPGAANIPATGAWSIALGSLPTGLTFNSNTGEITGTPTQTGVFIFTVKVIDSAGEWATKVESITVNSKPTITTSPLAVTIFTTDNAAISNSANAGTGALLGIGAWTATGLPAGLSINTSTGLITGTPAGVGVSTVTLKVTDVNGLFDEETLTITVTLPVYGPTVTTAATTYKFGVNNNISVALDDFLASPFPLGKARDIINTATKGTNEILAVGAWSATNLPPGLSINANTGKISGTATTVGVYETVVKVTDTIGKFGTKTLTINIVQGPKNTTPLNYTYEVDIPKKIGLLPVLINQTYTLGDAALSNARPVPFLVQGGKPSMVTEVNIVSGQIQVIPALAIGSKAGYGSFKLKTVIVDANGAYDMVTFTINIVKSGTNITSLTLPDSIANGTLITENQFTLAGTSSKKLPVTYSVTTPKVCEIDTATKKLKLLDGGKCSVTASSGTGALLSKDTKEFTITQLPQVVTIIAPGELVPGTLQEAPMPTDDPAGFQLYASVDTGLAPVYTSLDPNVCSVDAVGVVTWDADLTALPRVEADFHCRVSVSQPGDFTRGAAPAQVITLDATHVEPPAPEGGIAREPAQTAALPAKGGSTPMKGGNSFVVKVDTTKKVITLSPLSKGRWIGPIYADIKISYTPKGSTVEENQICARNYFGIAAKDSKTKKILTPALGGDMTIVPEMAKNAKDVTALIKTYQAMQGKYAVTKTVKGKKVVLPGYLDYKYFTGEATCVLNAKAYEAWKSGIQIKAVATVTRDRRWPTLYTRYKSTDWKNKVNSGTIYPTVVDWVITVG